MGDSNLQFMRRMVCEQEAEKTKRHAARVERQEKSWMLDFKRRQALDHVIVEKENYRSMLQYAKQLAMQTRLQSHKVSACPSCANAELVSSNGSSMSLRGPRYPTRSTIV